MLFVAGSFMSNRAPDLLARLRENPELNAWISHLESVDLDGFEVDLPSGVDVVNILLDMSVPHVDINPILALRPDPDSDAWWLLERSVALLSKGLGRLDSTPEFPLLTDGSDEFLRYFYVYVFAAAYPLVCDWYRERGIDAEIGRRSLADLGRQMAHHRRRLGCGGLNLHVDWLAEHFTGRLFQLGRLQFDRSGVGRTTSRELQAAGFDIQTGDPVLGVHIPDYLGPFDPAACDESFAMAREFFSRYFPEEKLDIVLCYSWLLSRDLATYLSPASNILAFQRRFTINYRDSPPQDEDFFQFVFQRSASEVDSLPQDTTLQRAIVQHVRDGKHWYGGVGWCRL
jgi:hypothetical protein